MIDEEEWDWIVEHSRGSFDHLIVASTLPVFMSHGLHHLESWNQAVCNGVWGRTSARVSERLRRAVDLEHWPAFHDSFERFVDLLRIVSHGFDGKPPATITVLGGDVHTAYVAEVSLGTDAGPSRVYQIVCSPFRNPLTPSQRRVVRVTGSRLAGAVFSLLARACGVAPPTAVWTLVNGPTFDNSIGELELDERTARVTISRPAARRETGPALQTLHKLTLSEE
jgi:hypothetical protein